LAADLPAEPDCEAIFPIDIRMFQPKFATEKSSPRAVRFRLPRTHYSHRMSILSRREVRVMDGSGWVQEPAQRDRGGRDHAERGADGQQGARPAAAEPAENSVAETPPVVLAFAELGADLHPACNDSEGATPGEAAEMVEATEEAPRPPLPERGSSCIRPAISRPASRHAGPIDPGAAAADDLHFACIVRRNSRAHSAGDGEAAMTAAEDAPLFRPTSDSCIRPAISRFAGPIGPDAAAMDCVPLAPPDSRV
jgi:hypothetical protein